MTIAPQPVYNPARTEHPPERRGVSRRSVIEAAKEAVPCVDLADLLCGAGGMKRRGSEWIAKCPLPDHDDKTPSFTANPAKNLWFCHGCARGGDVVELARFAYGFEKSEAPMAAAFVLEKFGHEIPARPDSWFRKNARQAPVREAIRQRKIEALRRRLFRVMMLPLIEAWTGEADRRAELEAAWEDFRAVPVESLLDRMDGER